MEDHSLQKNGNWKRSDPCVEWNEFYVYVKIILLQIWRRQVEDVNVHELEGQIMQNTRILTTANIFKCVKSIMQSNKNSAEPF